MGLEYFELADSCLRKADGNKDSAVEIMTRILMADVKSLEPMVKQQCSYYIMCADQGAFSEEESDELIDPADVIRLGLSGEWPR